MSGVKGCSGGARRGAGRMQTRLLLSRVAAQELKVVVSHKQAFNVSIRAEDIVEQWIHEQWQEIDAQYQDNQSNMEEE